MTYRETRRKSKTGHLSFALTLPPFLREARRSKPLGAELPKFGRYVDAAEYRNKAEGLAFGPIGSEVPVPAWSRSAFYLEEAIRPHRSRVDPGDGLSLGRSGSIRRKML